MTSRFKSGYRRQIFGAFLLGLSLFAVHAYSDTPWVDIDAKLSIEIGNGNEDYADETESVEKGRFVTYKLEVTNTGTETHSGLVALMETPMYMAYVPGSATFTKDSTQGAFPLPDIDNESALVTGFKIDNLFAGFTAVFTVRYQVNMVVDDPVYTLAWANVLGKYSVMPTVSNLIETRISGEAKANLSVVPKPSPVAGQSVNSGSYITYEYKLTNVGGLPATGIVFKTPDVPAHTTCITNCGTNNNLASLAPGESRSVTMLVQVNADLQGATEIVNTGYDLDTNESEAIKKKDPIIHPIGIGTDPEGGDFTVTIRQEPNIILNSANGAARPDKGDLTETVYEIWYRGRGHSNTYPMLSDSSSDFILTGNGQCYQYYPNRRGATTYAYNSSGGMCDYILDCPPHSQTIALSVQTKLPVEAPKLLFTKNTTSYQYGEASPDYTVNNYMKNGGTFELPRNFTESRAVENGANGIVGTKVDTTVLEDLWQYVQYDSWECSYSCGDDCTATVDMPLYRWEEVSSVPVALSDQDTTDITVYTSTAWLKTEGGHIGTNDRFTNGALTPANIVDLGTGLGMKPDFLTPSGNYTPIGETNSEFMIFGKNGTGEMKSEKVGEVWKQTGTEFPFLEKGEAYDRPDANNPRDYYVDMLERQMYGAVKTDALDSKLTGTVEIGDGIVWNNNADITIGEKGGAEVVFTGGQSRIYTTGDVYINSDIRLGTSAAQSYNAITSLRIDAKNIYVDGSVTNLEVMLLARGEFHSGKSKNQLRVLGDVIAKNANWEREPLLELSPTEFNKPSEYIIEDMRKYVVPVPGDTTLPDDYNIWRQVNPATGETLDAY